jgi:hypothetical protein
MVRHPGVKPLLAWIGQGEPFATPDPAQGDAEVISEETAQGLAKRGAGGVSGEMGAQPLSQGRA